MENPGFYLNQLVFTHQLVVDDHGDEQHGAQGEGLPIGGYDGQHADGDDDDNANNRRNMLLNDQPSSGDGNISAKARFMKLKYQPSMCIKS